MTPLWRLLIACSLSLALYIGARTLLTQDSSIHARLSSGPQQVGDTQRNEGRGEAFEQRGSSAPKKLKRRMFLGIGEAMGIKVAEVAMKPIVVKGARWGLRKPAAKPIKKAYNQAATYAQDHTWEAIRQHIPKLDEGSPAQQDIRVRALLVAQALDFYFHNSEVDRVAYAELAGVRGKTFRVIRYAKKTGWAFHTAINPISKPTRSQQAMNKILNRYTAWDNAVRQVAPDALHYHVTVRPAGRDTVTPYNEREQQAAKEWMGWKRKRNFKPRTTDFGKEFIGETREEKELYWDAVDENAYKRRRHNPANIKAYYTRRTLMASWIKLHPKEERPYQNTLHMGPTTAAQSEAMKNKIAMGDFKEQSKLVKTTQSAISSRVDGNSGVGALQESRNSFRFRPKVNVGIIPHGDPRNMPMAAAAA